MKVCKICKQNKPLDDFPVAVTTRDKKDIYCRVCKKAAQAAWYASNRKMAKMRNMLHRAKKRAKIKALAFTLKMVDLGDPVEKCPVLGLTLNWDHAGLPAGDSPSLDRIDNSLGYVRGNVMIISHRANMIKCDATAEEVQAVAAWMS